MGQESVHEPDVELMSAANVWYDALNLAETLRSNLLRSEPMVRLQVPFSLFLSALEEFNREELVLLRRRVEERLAA